MYYRRWLHNRLLSPVSNDKVRLIFGARQTGKTMLLSQVLNRDHSIVYNLQDSSLRRKLERDPAQFSRELEALPPSITHVFVDEIQKVPALLDEVHRLIENHGRRFRTTSVSWSIR